jgi:hypothetical protein
MVLRQDVFAQYNDVISWLEQKRTGDPTIAHYIIKHNLDIVAEAFKKPVNFVEYLLENSNINIITREEKEIIEFYFKLFRKRMN